MDKSSVKELEMNEKLVKRKVRMAIAQSEKEIKEGNAASNQLGTRIVANTCFKRTNYNKIPFSNYNFQKLETVKDLTPFDHMNLSSAHMRNILHKIYVKQRRIPTIADIMQSAKDIRFCDSTSPKGFIFLPITSNKGIIVENQERVGKRTAYIMKMDNFRKNGQHFIYVYTKYIQNVTEKRYVLTAVSSKNGYLSSSDIIQSVDEEIKFLIDVLSSIEGHCVLVLEEKEDEKLLPTAGSSKSTMSAWLKKNNIPHVPKSHRSELYSLIQKMKNVVSYTTKVDEIILGLGHEVISRPSDMEELDFFRTFYISADEYNNVPLKTWLEFEDKLIATEKTMYINDLMMEKIIDSLMTFAKDTEEPETMEGLLDIKDINKIYKTIISE